MTYHVYEEAEVETSHVYPLKECGVGAHRHG